MSTATAIQVPAEGAKIVPGEPAPDNPIIPFIEGDGIGVDITPVMRDVVDAAVEKAYGGARKIAWMEIYAGEKSTRVYGADEWLPVETLDAVREYSVAIKGPMTTPVGGGIRSLNVALRQELDLYVCLRPVRWFKGVPSPLKDPSGTDMVIFRENTEDIYAGIEWEAESDGARRVISFLQDEMQVRKIRFPDTSGVGIKPVSREGTERLVRRAIRYALDHGRASVTLVHKGNIMKFTEGAFRDWGYELAEREFDAKPLDGGPWMTIGDLVVKDMIADAFLQQILLRPREYDVIATTNLNGDYIHNGNSQLRVVTDASACGADTAASWNASVGGGDVPHVGDVYTTAIVNPNVELTFDNTTSLAKLDVPAGNYFVSGNVDLSHGQDVTTTCALWADTTKLASNDVVESSTFVVPLQATASFDRATSVSVRCNPSFLAEPLVLDGVQLDAIVVGKVNRQTPPPPIPR